MEHFVVHMTALNTMFNVESILGYIVFASVFVLAVMVLTYNRMVALRDRCHKAFASIDAQLKMRHDLVPNLTKLVRQYARKDCEVFEKVTVARSQAMAARSVEEKARTENQLGRALADLFAIAENYPDLIAQVNYQHFHSELSDIERAVAVTRRFFNYFTAEFNSAIEKFPAIFIARRFNFEKKTFFDMGMHIASEA